VALPPAGPDGELLGGLPGELGEVDASPDLSVFLERFVPELLSRAEFLHAASPNSGIINAMASNAFNLMCSPPFVEL
jgi:hypothetical protein